MIRSSYIGFDEAFCAVQGFVGACLINAYKIRVVCVPYNAAVGLAGFAFVEKLVHQVSSRVIPGFSAYLGPIPIGTKNIVSYGVATLVTFKIMQIAGLILTIPEAVTTFGLACSALLALGCFKKVIDYGFTPVDIEAHLNSQSFANQIIQFEHENEKHDIRVICNPERKAVTFCSAGVGRISCKGAYILASNSTIPQAFFDRYESLEGASVFSAIINSALPLDYTKSPTVT